MPLTLVTAPAAATTLISAADARAHMRQDGSADDTLIEGLIAAAVLHLEGKDGWLGRCFLTQTWDLKLDAFPAVIRLPLAPVSAITHIKYLDTAGVEQTLSSALYVTDLVTEPGRITPAFGQVWPSTYSQVNAVTVRLVAGYADAAAVPEPLKLGIKALVAHLYEHRGEAVTEMPSFIQALLASYRVWPLECAA